MVEHYAPDTILQLEDGQYKHLYAIGSILGFGCQKAVVWGSGLLMPYRLYLKRLKLAEPDIRAVRGPKTREELLKIGIQCPEVYGDPAVLMPEIYQPMSYSKKYEVSLITHFSQNDEVDDYNLHGINMLTTNYQYVIDEICKSKKVISSSLHGIILSEIYNVPAVLWIQPGKSKFKYEDYYYSTDRFEVITAESVEEALELSPMEIPSFEVMRDNLKKSFPVDLWEGKLHCR